MSDSDDSQYSDEVWCFYFFLYYFMYILPLSLFVCSNFIVLKFQTRVGTFWCTWVVCTNYKGKKLCKYFNKISRRGYLLMQLHISFLYFSPGATKYVKFYIKSRFSMYVLPHSNESCLLHMKSLSCELYAAFVGYFLVKNFCGKGGHFYLISRYIP